jgi:hypothetical protein
MTDEPRVACSLGAAALGERLSEIGRLGADALLARERSGDRHLLRFRAGASTRERLERIVAAERECCSFLELELGSDGDELLLSISAPQAGGEVAAELAGAFGPPLGR